MIFNRRFWFGVMVGMAAGAFIRQRKVTGVTQERLDEYYRQRARNYHLTDYLFLGQFPRITMRQTLMDMADLKPGQHVLDFACGTGSNFPFIMERIGPAGRLVASDYSPDMLEMAAELVKEKGWDNVELVQADAAQMHFDEQFDLVMTTLGLAVIPGWEVAMERAWTFVKPGGLFGTADIKESERWYTQPIRFVTDLIDMAIIADSSRRPWEKLAIMPGVDYQYREIFHGYFYAATLRKPE